MSDENAVKTWWNQASVATTSNQTSTTTSTQTNDDFVLDFWEDDTLDVEDSKTNVSDKNKDSVPESDWNDIKKSDWDKKISWLDESSKNGEKIRDDENSKDNESSKINESNDWDDSFSWLDDNEDSLDSDGLFDDDTENIEDNKNNEEGENIEEGDDVNSNENIENNEDIEDIKSSETAEKDVWDEMFSWLDDNDKDSLNGDDLFDDDTENVEDSKNNEEVENVEDNGSIDNNESAEVSETIEDRDTVSEPDSDDDFDIDLDSSLNNDSSDSDQFNLDDDSVDNNKEENNEEKVTDSGDNEELRSTNTESDSNFQIDLDFNQGSWEESTQPTDLDWIEEESNSEGVDDSKINNEQFEDSNDMHDINFREKSDDEEIHDDIDSEEIQDNTLENEWNDEILEFTDNTNDESLNNENMSVDIDFTENVSDEENLGRMDNNSDILANDSFSNNLNDTNETIENNTNENSEQTSENAVDVEFNLTDSSNSEPDLLQNSSNIEWLDNNDTNQNNEVQLNDALDNSNSNDSQILSFDLSNNSETEESVEQQPNLQDYLSNQTSDAITQSSEEEIQESNESFQSLEEESLEANQPVDITNLDNESSNENNNSGRVLDNTQPESMSFDINLSQPVAQPLEQTVSEDMGQSIPTNEENTGAANWFSLDFTGSNTNSDSNIQGPINQDAPQENQFTTSPTEFGVTSTEINNDSTTSDNTDNGINFTLWGEEEPKDEPEVVQIQSTLSLDQILDSELSSNPQYSNNSVAIPENTWGKKSKSSKLGLIFAWGLFITAGIVAVLAFPSLLSTSNPWETNGSWDVVAIGDHWIAPDTGLDVSESGFTNPDFPDPDFLESDSFNTSTEWNNSGEASLGWTTVRSTVEFPDPYGWMDDDEWIDGLNNDPEPTPYISGTGDIIHDEDPEEYKQILINDIKSSISSFKSSAEWYYSWGQEHSDRKIIKYASQIINACDTYESQISAWEWISQEALSEFESKVLDIFNKIDDYNNWWEGSPQVIQNNTTQNNGDNSSTEKDKMREFLYSRE